MANAIIVRDSNDIPFNEYSLDFFAFLNLVFERLFGAGTSGSPGVVSGWDLDPAVLVAFLSNAWSVFVLLSWLLSALFLFGLIYAYIRGEQLGEVTAAILKKQEEDYKAIYETKQKNGRWQDVLNHIDSDRMNDWKLAIIEADIMLEEVLDAAGFPGATVADKLKNASPNSFRTVDQAWRAHLVRNKIAHEGADFEISKHVAQETIAQYKMVFEELQAI